MTARILPPTAENVALAAAALRAGNVVGMPTETVYGLAGAAFRPDALARIFETKERPTFDPLILHVSPETTGLAGLEKQRLISLRDFSATARARADQLIRKFWPGPLTLILPKHEDVPDLATSGLPTVAIRMPRHPVAQALIRAAETPLAAPSANRFGRISPTSAQDVASELGDRIALILDGGPCEIGLESTIVSVEPSGSLTLLRPGGIPPSEIEALTGISLLRPIAPTGEKPLAPGSLESHYAPSKPLLLLPSPVYQVQAHTYRNLITQNANFQKLKNVKRVGLLILSGNATEAQDYLSSVSSCSVLAKSLSREGDLSEAARNLFSMLRQLDQSDVQAIFSEPCRVEEGLGHAIADRLRRASAGHSGLVKH